MSGYPAPPGRTVDAMLPPLRPPSHTGLPPLKPPSRHAAAVAESHIQALPKVVVSDTSDTGRGLVAAISLSEGEVMLEEAPLLRETTLGDLQLEAKVARLIRSFGADSRESPCDGDLMVKRIKALLAMSAEAKETLLGLADGQDVWPPAHPKAEILRRVAELASSALQSIPSLWPVAELQQGLELVSSYATEAELVYELGCRANHSCSPNAHAHVGSDGKLRLRATKPVSAGAAITVSYLAGLSLLHWQARQRFLWDQRGFVCACESCRTDRVSEELDTFKQAPLEPDAEPDGEQVSYASSEPDSELSSMPRPRARPQRLLPQSHLRCVRCLPSSRGCIMVDQTTYMRWLADSHSVPVLRRMGRVDSERRTVIGAAWYCGVCGLKADLQSERSDEVSKQIYELAHAEMQLVYQALQLCIVTNAADLMELWPTCERTLGPWHGVTLFCALQALPFLSEDRAYKVRARLAVAGVDDKLVSLLRTQNK